MLERAPSFAIKIALGLAGVRVRSVPVTPVASKTTADSSARAAVKEAEPATSPTSAYLLDVYPALEESLKGSDLEDIKAKKEALAKASQNVAMRAYQKAQQANQQNAGTQNANDDNVVDAEFEDSNN